PWRWPRRRWWPPGGADGGGRLVVPAVSVMVAVVAGDRPVVAGGGGRWCQRCSVCPRPPVTGACALWRRPAPLRRGRAAVPAVESPGRLGTRSRWGRRGVRPWPLPGRKVCRCPALAARLPEGGARMPTTPPEAPSAIGRPHWAPSAATDGRTRHQPGHPPATGAAAPVAHTVSSPVPVSGARPTAGRVPSPVTRWSAVILTLPLVGGCGAGAAGVVGAGGRGIWQNCTSAGGAEALSPPACAVPSVGRRTPPGFGRSVTYDT